MLAVAEVDKRVEAVGALDDHVAAAPAVAAGGAAELDVLLAAEGNAAVAAVATFHEDPYFIEKFHGLIFMAEAQ